MAGGIRVPDNIHAGDFDDVPVPTGGDVGKALVWNGSAYVYTAFAALSHTHTASQVTDFTEAAQDVVGAFLVDSSTIDYTYDDAGNAIAVDVKNSSITYAKLQNVSATDKLLGRATAGAGVVEEIPLTAFGRSLIAAAADSDVRTLLGLTALATATEANYALVSGARAMAVSQAQTFTNAIVVPGIRPASNAVDATGFANAGGTRIVSIDTTNNRVGLGTLAPEVALHAASAANAVYRGIFVQNSNGGNAAVASFAVGESLTGGKNFNISATGTSYTGIPLTALLYAESGMTGGMSFLTAANAPISFRTNNAYSMIIRETNNVYFAKNIEFEPTTSTTTPTAIQFFRQSDSWQPVRIGQLYSGAGYGGVLVFSTNDGSLAGALVERMRITSAGRVGIANDPTAYMDLPPSTTAAASLRIRTGVAPTSPNTGESYQDGTHVYMWLAGSWKQLDN